MADYLVKLQPDAIVYLIGMNDVGLARPKPFDAEGIRGELDLRSISSLFKSLTGYSELAAVGVQLYRWNRARRMGLQHVNFQIETARTGPLESSGEVATLLERHRSYLRGFGRRIERLIALTREVGALPILVTQPLLIGEGVDDVTGVSLRTVRTGLYGPDISGQLAWVLLESYNDVTRFVAEKHRVGLIDLARQMAKTSRHFYDATHYTNAGSVEVARIVSAGLCGLLADGYPEHVRQGCPSSSEPDPSPGD